MSRIPRHGQGGATSPRGRASHTVLLHAHAARRGNFLDRSIRSRWLIDRWTGTPVNAAPDEHDAVAWFETSDLDSLRLAHESYLSMLTAVLVT
jgi:hypothetical protein